MSSQVQGHVFVGHSNAGGLENTFQSVTQSGAQTQTFMQSQLRGPVILVKQFA
jgi:hypothetical protein